MKINQLYEAKALDEIPVCPLKCLVIVSNHMYCPLLSKGLGHSLQLLLLSFIYLHYQKNPKNMFASIFTVIP